MFPERPRVNNQIIEEEKQKREEFFGEYAIHQSLEAARTILKSKRHPMELKMASLAGEGRLGFAFFIELDLPVTAGEI